MEESEISRPAFLHIHIVSAFASAAILMMAMLAG